MLIEDHTSRCLRQVGIKALTELAERPDVTTDDRRLIDATLSVALAPLEPAWDDVQDNGGSVLVIDLDPERPEQEEA